MSKAQLIGDQLRHIDEPTWELLGRKPSGEKLVARIAIPEISDWLVCAIDSKGHRHLLVQLANHDEQFTDFKSRGVKVMTRELSVSGRSPKYYLDIECLDTDGHPALNIIGGEIATALANSSDHPTAIAKRVLEKWRRFWGQAPQVVLSREEQIGLFAELWFFLKWLYPMIGAESISAWKGPWGRRHDFEWTDKSVEVKASTNSQNRIFRVNSLEQLEPPETGPLFFFGLRLREEEAGTESLPKLVNGCRQVLSKQLEHLDYLESGLANVGYSLLHEGDYQVHKFRIIEQLLLIVVDDFPKLTPSAFSRGIPPGVAKINYEINLDLFNPLVIASEPRRNVFEL